MAGPGVIYIALLLLSLFCLKLVVALISRMIEEISRFQVIFPLIFRRSSLLFFPKTITKEGEHYAVKIGKFTGFMRSQGFRMSFSPVVNVFEDCISVFSFSEVLSLNVSFHVEREDDNHLRLSAPTLSFGKYKSPYLEFVQGDVAVLGYVINGRNRVQVQAAPYVGCDLLLTEYEECRFRVGTKPNMGYLAFISKDMDMSGQDIPRMTQALKEELRPVYYEPWVTSKVLGGDGNVETTPLHRELDVDLDSVQPLGKILPAPHSAESIVYKVNKSGEELTYQDRIQKYVRSDFEVDDEMKEWANEFTQLVIAEKDINAGTFEDLETILESQRPSQKLGYDQIRNIQDMLYVDQDKTFQKNEVYPEFKAPRNIINPGHGKRVLTAGMVKPLSKYLKEHSLKHIYGFGDAKYLSETFTRVEYSVNVIPGVPPTTLDMFETDGTKMDATIIKFIRGIELNVLKRFFRKEDHAAVEEIHNAQYFEDPKTKFGTKMRLAASRRSGEGGTSIFNTLTMVYVFYCWLRHLKYTPKVAWLMLGAYGGDDGLTPAWGSEESLIKVAARVNIILKVNRVPNGEPYSFLGMTKFPGMELYVPDVARFCGKIAYSHVKNVPVEQVLIRKCLPYVQMFPNVPLVGNMCRAVLRILKNQKKFTTDPKYDDLCRTGAGFVMTMLEGTSLPSVSDANELLLVESWTCKVLGISLTTLRRACAAYDNAKSFAEFPAGYITNGNTLLSCKYEVLIRDLYIPGQSEVKFIDHLPTESLHANGCTISKQDDNKKTNSTNAGPDGACSSSSSTSETSSICSKDSQEAKSKGTKGKRPYRKKKSPAIQAGDGISKVRPSSS